MTLETQLLQALHKMPESLKQELLHYAEYLLEKYIQTEPSSEQTKPIHGYGSWKGDIVMSDDFDAPLEDLENK